MTQANLSEIEVRVCGGGGGVRHDLPYSGRRGYSLLSYL